jgi:hypothetical protein
VIFLVLHITDMAGAVQLCRHGPALLQRAVLARRLPFCLKPALPTFHHAFNSVYAIGTDMHGTARPQLQPLRASASSSSGAPKKKYNLRPITKGTRGRRL